MPLSPENLLAYHDQGYLVLPGFFPAATMETVVDEVEKSMADGEVFAAQRAHFSFARNEVDGKFYVLQALRSEELSPTLKALIFSPQVLDLVAPILGPDVDLFQAKLVFKKAQGGAEVPWHQDFDYWKTMSKAPLQLNFGIYLDDTNRENGCLEVIPGSHKAGLLNHSNRKDLLNFPIQWNAAPEANRVQPIEGPKGTVVLFTALTAHHSQVNLSQRRRLFLNLVFTPARNDHVSTLPVARKAGLDPAGGLDPARIPVISGPGPHGGQCGAQYRTKELWKQAVAESDPALVDWVYLHANQASDSAPEWFAARKGDAVNFVHFQGGSGKYPGRDKVRFLNGDLADNLLQGRLRAALAGKLGLLVLQSSDYFTVKRVLEHFEPALRPGSLLLCESCWDGPRWEEGAAQALLEFARREKLGLTCLGRTESGLLVRVAARGEAHAIAYADAPWSSITQGIVTGFGLQAQAAPAPPLNPVKRIKKVLAPLREDHFPSPYYRDFFPRKKIPHFKGGNLGGPCCGTHLRRKELWKYALACVGDPTLSWAEFGVGEGESLDWFALHKPKENLLFGFDSFEGIPEAWASAPKGQWKTKIYAPNRADVRIVAGLYDESLARPEVVAGLGKRLGFVHVDCDLYSSTRAVFSAIKGLIGPGTVLVFDELYGYRGWQKNEARAFFELAEARKLEFEYLARSDGQVAVRVVSIGARWQCSVREIRWHENGNGIRLDRDEDLVLGYSTRKVGEFAKVFLKRMKQRLIRT